MDYFGEDLAWFTDAPWKIVGAFKEVRYGRDESIGGENIGVCNVDQGDTHCY